MGKRRGTDVRDGTITLPHRDGARGAARHRRRSSTPARADDAAVDAVIADVAGCGAVERAREMALALHRRRPRAGSRSAPGGVERELLSRGRRRRSSTATADDEDGERTGDEAEGERGVTTDEIDRLARRAGLQGIWRQVEAQRASRRRRRRGAPALHRPAGRRRDGRLRPPPRRRRRRLLHLQPPHQPHQRLPQPLPVLRLQPRRRRRRRLHAVGRRGGRQGARDARPAASPRSTSSAASTPTLPYDYYLEMLRGLKELAPDVHIQAFTASEIELLRPRGRQAGRPRSSPSSRRPAWARCPAAAPRCSAAACATSSASARSSGRASGST